MARSPNDVSPVLCLLVSATDHLTGQTGKTPSIYISKAGAAGVVPVGTVAEVDSTNLPGLYKWTPAAGDLSTVGELGVHVTATGCDPVDFKLEVQSNAAELVLTTPTQKLVTDATGAVTVGTVASAALTSIRQTLEATGSVLDTLQTRLTSAIATKLGLLAVDGTGQVTVGVIASAALTSIVTALQAAGTTLATVLARVTGAVALNTDMQTVLTRVPGQVATNADMQTVLTRVPSLVATDTARQSDTTSILNAIAGVGVGGGGSGVTATQIATAVRTELTTELARIDAPISGVPALAGTAATSDLVATADWKILRAVAEGHYTYAPPAGGGAGSGTLVLYDLDGVTVLKTMTLTVDTTGTVTARS